MSALGGKLTLNRRVDLGILATMKSQMLPLKLLFILAVASIASGPWLRMQPGQTRWLVSIIICVVGIALALQCLRMRPLATTVIALLLGVGGLVASEISMAASEGAYVAAHADLFLIAQSFVLLAVLAANYAAGNGEQSPE